MKFSVWYSVHEQNIRRAFNIAFLGRIKSIICIFGHLIAYCLASVPFLSWLVPVHRIIQTLHGWFQDIVCYMTGSRISNVTWQVPWHEVVQMLHCWFQDIKCNMTGSMASNATVCFYGWFHVIKCCRAGSRTSNVYMAASIASTIQFLITA